LHNLAEEGRSMLRPYNQAPTTARMKRKSGGEPFSASVRPNRIPKGKSPT
jgi:hypothetical protein